MRNSLKVFRMALLLAFFLAAIPAEARLGFTRTEWEAEFGKPDAKGVYRWEGPERGRGGPFLMMIRVEEDRVTGIQIRKESGHRFATTLAREILAALRLSDEHPVFVGDALSEDDKTITFVMPEPPKPTFTAPGAGMADKGTALMGKYTQDWIKAFGKPDGEGYFRSGAYRLQTATNKNSGKVDWIRVLKVSGEAFTEEEMERLYESLTGRKTSEVPNPPGLHKENTMLLILKPKRSK